MTILKTLDIVALILVACGAVITLIYLFEAVAYHALNATVILTTGERVTCPEGLAVIGPDVLCRTATKDGAAGFIVRGFALDEVDHVDVRR